jgi:predicted nucleotidyltransferase
MRPRKPTRQQRRCWWGGEPCLLPQNGSMAVVTTAPIEQRLAGMAAEIRQLVPAAEVRLFGSRARGEARPDSDVDLLITAPDAWLATRDRFALLGDLWGAVAQPDLSVDLVLHSNSEAARRAQEPGSLVHQAIQEGVLLNGHP